jgi:hypothetical protein
MNMEQSQVGFNVGEEVKHLKFGTGFIRILKPSEKSFVEFISPSGKDDKNSGCVWVKNSELVKLN